MNQNYKRAKFMASNIMTRHVLFVMLLLSCSSEKSQREEYEDITSGFKYRTYKAASAAAVSPAVKAYNSQQPTDTPLEDEYAHLLLGYFWAVSSKPALAFAEADIVAENKDGEVQHLARALRSITMYEQGWDTLAKEESMLATKGLQKKSGADAQYEATVFYFMMGSLFIYKKDFTQAKFFWAGFGNESGIHWPYKLSDAIADIQNGHTQQGLGKIKVLSQDPAVPEPLRKVLADEIQKLEKHANADVDSFLFWPKLISNLLLDELKRSTNAQLRACILMVEEVRDKLPV